MKCYEYEGKRIFEKYNIPIQKGVLAENLTDAISFFQKIKKPCVLKAQVLSGKRGKAGGIKFAENLAELKNNFNAIKGMDIYGETVNKLLVLEKIDIKQEFYLGITIDPLKMVPILIFSTEGGMDIEEVAIKHPEKILKFELKETQQLYHYYDMLIDLDFNNSLLSQLVKIMAKLSKLCFETDASIVEINPLVMTDNNNLIAADSKLVIDDSAMYRQKHLGLEKKLEDSNPLVQKAEKEGLSYVPLDKSGDIGSIAGGAGLAMATMDTIRYCGGKPANFLDIGGGASEQKMAEAIKIIASQEGVRGLVINVFGGINNCEFMAKGIKKAVKENNIKIKIVVKMRGHFQEIGWKILEEMHIPVIKHGTTEEAVKLLLEILKGRKENVNIG